MEARPDEPYGRVLLNLLLPIGDTLFATPAIRALRQRYPQARLTAVVWPSNRAVLENNPDLDELIAHPTGPASAASFLQAVRSLRCDLAVHFAPFHDYWGPLYGIPRQLKLPCPWLFWLLPHGNRRWQLAHAVDHYLDVLRPLGLRGPHPRKLVLNVTGQQEAFASRFLADHGHQPGEPLVGIHAGGYGFRGAKRWSPEGFAWVARQLGTVRLVFFGGPADRDLAEAVVAAGVPDGFVDTSGRLTLSQTIGVLSQLDLFIGNDSGPLHLAAALGTPVVGIYGPTSSLTFHPVGPRVRVVSGPVACPANHGFIGTRPVWDRRACQGECLDSVEPAQVVAAAQELLAAGETTAAAVPA